MNQSHFPQVPADTLIGSSSPVHQLYSQYLSAQAPYGYDLNRRFTELSPEKQVAMIANDKIFVGRVMQTFALAGVFAKVAHIRMSMATDNLAVMIADTDFQTALMGMIADNPAIVENISFGGVLS